jgi:acetyl esterase/lipase
VRGDDILELYFGGTDLRNPLVSPVYTPAVLKKFPPTLIITSTRDIGMSNAVYTHTQLSKAGVDADLHVWEGVGHCFLTDGTNDPESEEAWDVVVHFFQKHLGKP